MGALLVGVGCVLGVCALIDMGMNEPGRPTAAHLTLPAGLVCVVTGVWLL